jgi:GTPase
VTTGTEGRCGFVAIVGRPNTGKSTLLNALVGQKISIVTDKPHTTRHRILGVLNRGNDQAVFIDTPGHARRSDRALHRLMARALSQAVSEADLVLLVVDARGLKAEDRQLIEQLRDRGDQCILVLNKVDRVAGKQALLPMLQEVAQECGFAAYVPLSALSGDNVDALCSEIFARLPQGPLLYPPEFTTDPDTQFRAAEIVREKLMQLLHDELPYGLTVEIEHLGRHEDGQWVVHALIWVERESHKPIVIGKSGRVLKDAGTAARIELKSLLNDRVHLAMWVKVREHWSDSERELKRFGYDLS